MELCHKNVVNILKNAKKYWGVHLARSITMIVWTYLPFLLARNIDVPIFYSVYIIPMPNVMMSFNGIELFSHFCLT